MQTKLSFTLCFSTLHYVSQLLVLNFGLVFLFRFIYSLKLKSLQQKTYQNYSIWVKWMWLVGLYVLKNGRRNNVCMCSKTWFTYMCTPTIYNVVHVHTYNIDKHTSSALHLQRMNFLFHIYTCTLTLCTRRVHEGYT